MLVLTIENLFFFLIEELVIPKTSKNKNPQKTLQHKNKPSKTFKLIYTN